MQSSCNQEQPSQLLNNEKGQQSVLMTKLHCLIFHKIIFIDYQKATDYFKVQSINKTSSILTTKNTIFQSKAVPRHMRQTRGPRATPSSDVYCSAAAHTSLWQPRLSQLKAVLALGPAVLLPLPLTASAMPLTVWQLLHYFTAQFPFTFSSLL